MELEPIPATIRHEAGYTVNQSVTGPTQRQTTMHTQPHRQFRITNWPNMDVFWLCKEARVPRYNPHMHMEDMQTPHRKAPAESWDSNQEPHCLALMVLTTTSPCSTVLGHTFRKSLKMFWALAFQRDQSQAFTPYGSRKLLTYVEWVKFSWNGKGFMKRWTSFYSGCCLSLPGCSRL